MIAGQDAQEPAGDRAALPFLPGDSAVGALIAARDWSGTPIAPIEGWSPAFRAALALVLAAPVPMILFWGAELVALYNDAYAAVIGGRHPAALGGKARERWAHAWAAIGTPIERAFVTGEATTRRDQVIMTIHDDVPAEAYFDVCFSAVRELEGAIGGVLAIAYDTTERVRAIRGATAERARLSQMFEQAPSFMALLREPGHVIELANAGYQQLTGQRAVTGLGIREALPEIVAQGFVDLLDQVVATGRPYRGRAAPTMLAYPDGSERHYLLDFVYQPVFGDDGTVVGVFVEGNDVTERVRAQEVLRESEQRFRTIADSAPALIWLCDETGELVFANQWHEKTFGRPARELLGGGWTGILHPDDVQGFCEDFDRAFAARAPFTRDVRVIDREGRTLWLHSEARPRHTEGRFVGYVGCDVDITEVHRVSESLERGIAERTGELAATNRQLSAQIEERERVEATLRQMQRLEAIGQLTSGVAHDFNNLLTVVLGNIDMVERAAPAGPLDERSLKRLSYIRAAAERGATLTAQLLAFSRRQRLEARPVALNEIVVGMRDLMQSSMGGSVRMEAQLQSELWSAMVDPTQIELIILNLAINARDAMAVGGSLIVSTGNVVLGEPAFPEEPAPGDYVMVAVTDSGTGMTAEVRAKAFEPFFTTKAVGKGSGLGLAQVFGFAKQSGGGVAIETEIGVGTTVRVYLPRAIERRRMPRPDLQPRAGEHLGDAGGRRILLVDDDGAVREVTASMLRAMGAEVIECDSGAAALALVEDVGGALDLMVVDFAMPGMNGAELTAAVQARWPDLPALFVTGYADLTALADVGADRIVQKPFRSDELQRKVARLLAETAAG